MRVNRRHRNSTRGTSSNDEDVPLVEFMYLVPGESLHACQVRVTAGDSGLCRCVCDILKLFAVSLVILIKANCSNFKSQQHK